MSPEFIAAHEAQQPSEFKSRLPYLRELYLGSQEEKQPDAFLRNEHLMLAVLNRASKREAASTAHFNFELSRKNEISRLQWNNSESDFVVFDSAVKYIVESAINEKNFDEEHIRQVLSNILLKSPLFAALHNREIPREGAHLLNTPFEHTMLVVKFCRTQHLDAVQASKLLFAAVMHDIGKIFTAKDDGHQIHAATSTLIAREYMISRVGESDKTIELLIHFHDVFGLQGGNVFTKKDIFHMIQNFFGEEMELNVPLSERVKEAFILLGLLMHADTKSIMDYRRFTVSNTLTFIDMAVERAQEFKDTNVWDVLSDLALETITVASNILATKRAKKFILGNDLKNNTITVDRYTSQMSTHLKEEIILRLQIEKLEEHVKEIFEIDVKQNAMPVLSVVSRRDVLIPTQQPKYSDRGDIQVAAS